MEPPRTPAMGFTDVSILIPPCSYSSPATWAYLFPYCLLILSCPPTLSLHIPVRLTGAQVTTIIVPVEPSAPSRSQNYFPSPTVSEQLARPNTFIHFSLFTPHSSEIPPCPLNQARWERLTQEYPDKLVIAALLGICQFGCRIGYQESRQKPTIHTNLSTSQAEPHVVSSEIKMELGKHRLKKYSSIAALPECYTALPLGLIDKSD